MPQFNTPQYKRKRDLIPHYARKAAKYVSKGASLASNVLPIPQRLFVQAAAGGFNRLVKRATRRQGKRLTKTYTEGKYRGKFVKPKKAGDKFATFANKGMLSTVETHGTISDPDCVYLNFMSVDPYTLIVVATTALFRKLFQLAGYSITNMDETIVGVAITDGKDIKIALTQVDGLTGVETVLTSSVSAAGSTYRSMADVFVGNFLTYSAGYSWNSNGNADEDGKQLSRLILSKQDYNTSAAYVLAAEINLRDEVMCVIAESECKIQNRTVSATGGVDADDVTANPIVGRSYSFPSIPKVRDRRGFLLNKIGLYNGMGLVRAAQVTSYNGYKEPPPASAFSNCKASALVRLEPGAIKSHFIKYSKNMHFLNFLRKIDINYGVADSGSVLNVYNSIFPCQLFAFEDIININTNAITCAYEKNEKLGVYFKTQKKASALHQFTAITLNNIPA